MKKILLTSDGIHGDDIKKEFLRLAHKDASKIKVLMIVTAGKLRPLSYRKARIDRTIRRIARLGIRKENIETLDIDGKNMRSIDRSFDVVYVCGGNTFFLLKKIRESGFAKAIRKFLDNGGLYVGISAGSYVACPTIVMASWKNSDRNTVGMKNFAAMSLVPFIITVHYRRECEKSVRVGMRKTNYKMRIVRDGQAVSVCGSRVRFIGKETRLK